ncbi:MAG: TetR/AcrR family transcriptional regulator [Deltaproteobacteria bacterium]|nr:TetR/AcrR family transcriptional regulator [Deltaproteobacteria bacterium]
MTGLNNIQLSALDLFARDSYEGVSMSRVAKGSGVKKSTIYAHFTGKENLYLSLLGPCQSREESFARDLLARPGDVWSNLYEYLKSFIARFELNPPHLKFIVRSRYAPPEPFQAEVREITQKHYQRMEKAVVAALERTPLDDWSPRDLAKAFMGVADSLWGCLLSDRDEAPSRFKSLWRLFRAAPRGERRENDGFALS